MLKERFTIPGTITSLLAKFGNITVADFGQSRWDYECQLLFVWFLYSMGSLQCTFWV